MARLTLLSILVALNLGFVLSRSTGPPEGVETCTNLRPAAPPTSPHVLQEGNGTYGITTNIPAGNDGYLAFVAGTAYNGSITSDSGNAIRGFLVTAVDPSGARIGTFTVGEGQRFLACSSINSVPDAATLVHSTPNSAASVPFTWTAPSGSNGMVQFRFTIVRSRTMYFGPLSSPQSSMVSTAAPSSGAPMASTAAPSSGAPMASTAAPSSGAPMASTAATTDGSLPMVSVSLVSLLIAVVAAFMKA